LRDGRGRIPRVDPDFSAFGWFAIRHYGDSSFQELALDPICDKDLVAACRDGDKTAYEELVGRHYRRVFGVCWGLLGSSHAAEDAAQEAFLKGIERIAELREGEQFGAWIGRIARNVSLDLIRKESRTRSILAELATPQPESRSDNHDLEGAIRRLPVELRGPLMLYYFGERNAKSIAESLGISHSLACQRLREARKELHRLLTEQGDAQ
jgi:RNA polymerase sigma-70 factor (ECF subfamily)